MHQDRHRHHRYIYGEEKKFIKIFEIEDLSVIYMPRGVFEKKLLRGISPQEIS
jgi:hypothetical protein